MFDFLRNLTKSAAEKRREQLTAYVDGELSDAERHQFEAEMAANDDLRAEANDLRQIKFALRRLPRLPVPRNFLLDPAQFQRAAPSPRQAALYPALRAATALAAFFFVILLATTVFRGPLGLGAQPASVMDANRNADIIAEGESGGANENQNAEAMPMVTKEELLVTVETEESFAADEETADVATIEEAEESASDAPEAHEEEAAATEPEAGMADEAESDPGTVDADAADGATTGGDEAMDGEGARQTPDATPTAMPTATPAPPRPEPSPSLPPRSGTDPAQVETEAVPPADAETAADANDVPAAPADPWPTLTWISGVLFLLLAGATLLVRRRL